MRRKRALRRPSTIENLLWLRLKALSEQGWHFRRNAYFRTFLLPFVAHEALLMVELDDGGKAPRNIIRDRLLREEGYSILRIPRADAVENLPSVVAGIRAVLQDRSN
jgi:very-short-patch-repair endonuclease